MSAQRDSSFAALCDAPAFDVVVVGGGINGIGVYRELALQGLRVLLVERNDFCSGCSAAPSRMIHGGLRYLENGEFDLVRESLAERDALLANAPHFVRPLPTTVPVTSVFSGTLNGAAAFFGWSGKPASRGALPIKLGLSLYDWVTRKRRVLPRHVFRGKQATRRRWPALTDRLRFSATYYDAWISHPERLGLELILDTAQDAPESVALNYAELTPKGAGFALRDRLSGQTYDITSRALVNATGAWLDESVALIAPDDGPQEKMVSGTKGSHLILENPALLAALDGHMIYFENDDGRICIVFPYLGKVLAGSTDIRVETATRVRCEPAERDYILSSLQLVFPTIGINADQIVFSYSGIRPLPQSDLDFTGRISRGHSIKRLSGATPQFCMVGGKWTTFRAFAEQTADAVLAELGHSRALHTQNRAIGGGAGFDQDGLPLIAELSQTYGITDARANHLVDLYGTRARAVLEYCAGQTKDQPLLPDCPYTTAEIAFLATREHVTALSDIILRRTDIAITGQVSIPLIARIAAVLAQELHWPDRETQQQKQALVAELQSFHGLSFDAPPQPS